MYIHIGADVSLPAHWIVGIFNLVRVAPAGATTDLMGQAEREGRLDWMTDDVPRSMVVTLDRVFLSPVSTATLRARLAGKSE